MGLDVQGRHVLVAGAGVTGRSIVPALLELGARVTVTDGNAERLNELADLGAELVPGLASPPEDVVLVVTSPGWRPTAPLLAAAADAGIEVIGDVELAWRVGQLREHPPAWLVITGTNGKTTTAGMLESILKAAGANAVACGNIGYAALDAVRAGYQVLAVELSSFQLHWSSTLSPDAAVVLNLAEDHIDWHGSMDEYAAAKGRAYARAKVVVHNADDGWSTRIADEHAREDARRVAFRLDTPQPGELGLVEDLLVDRAFVADPDNSAEELATVADVRPSGPHNIANALAAATLARAHGVTPEAVLKGLREYQPAPHRTVEVAEVGGVRYVNDSKATNPHAAAGSLAAFENVVWIAGGQLKGASVDELVSNFAGRLRGVVLLGVDSPVIAAAVARHAPDVPCHSLRPGDDEPMTAAVSTASAMARPGDVVLLAPAAASLDMFANYGARGDAFAAAVHALGDAAGESGDAG